MKLAITGATGLLGANLAIALLQRGHEVRCTRRRSSRADHLEGVDIEWVDAELGDVEGLARAFTGVDGVFHCAAMVGIMKKPTPEMVNANVKGTENVIAAIRQAGAGRLVHCSSTVAVGVSEDGQPLDESATWNMDRFGLADGYAVTKRAAEERVMDAAKQGLDAVVVNPGYMFGPHDQHQSSGRMIVDVVRGRVPGYSMGRNSFVGAADVAQGMIAALDKGARGQRYILAGHNMTYKDALALIAEVADVRPPRMRIPRALGAVAGLLGDVRWRLTGKEPVLNSNTVRWAYCEGYVFSSARAQRELGYEIRPVRESIAAAIDWFRQHGAL
jgi:dihydroflavonol-4-reductase